MKCCGGRRVSRLGLFGGCFPLAGSFPHGWAPNQTFNSGKMPAEFSAIRFPPHGFTQEVYYAIPKINAPTPLRPKFFGHICSPAQSQNLKNKWISANIVASKNFWSQRCLSTEFDGIRRISDRNRRNSTDHPSARKNHSFVRSGFIFSKITRHKATVPLFSSLTGRASLRSSEQDPKIHHCA